MIFSSLGALGRVLACELGKQKNLECSWILPDGFFLILESTWGDGGLMHYHMEMGRHNRLIRILL